MKVDYCQYKGRIFVDLKDLINSLREEQEKYTSPLTLKDVTNGLCAFQEKAEESFKDNK